jgi:hypothetical protein
MNYIYKMRKIAFILACVSICAMSCKSKTTPQEEQAQNSIESDVPDMEICQSCAMPLTYEFYGTNADGTLNIEYCKYCYADGQFTAPNLTREEMIEICIPFMVERGMPEGNARILLEDALSKVKRWKTQE